MLFFYYLRCFSIVLLLLYCSIALLLLYIYCSLLHILYIFIIIIYLLYIIYIYSSSIIYVLQFSYNTLRHLSHLLIQYNIDFTILYSYAFISHLDENDTLEYLMIKRHFVV